MERMRMQQAKNLSHKKRTKFGQSLLRRYFISYAGFALLLSGILCLFLSGMSVHMLRKQNIASAQEKLTVLSADMEDQFEQMRTSALKISYNPLYKYQNITRHHYNEIVMLDNFKLLSDRLPAVDDYCFLYHDDHYVYRSNGTKTELRLWLESVSDDPSLYTEMLDIPSFRILEGKDDIILYCFTIRTGINGEVRGSQNMASVIFVTSRETLSKRFTTLVGGLNGNIQIYYVDSDGTEKEFAGFGKVNTAETETLTAISQDGRFRVVWELPDPYRNMFFLLTSNRTTTLVVSVLLAGFICFSVILAFLNFLPIRQAADQVKEMAENMSLTGESQDLYRNEVEIIVDNYKELLLRLHYENQAAEDKQMSINALNAQMLSVQKRMKNQCLQLLLHGKLQPSSLEELSNDTFMNIRLQGPFYSIMLLRLVSGEGVSSGSVKRLIDKIEQYSDEKLNLSCVDMLWRTDEVGGEKVIAVVVSMCETELMADAREYVDLALEEVLSQTTQVECICSPLLCERLDQLPDAFEKTVGLLGAERGQSGDRAAFGAYVGSDALKRRLQTALRLGRGREAHSCLDMILEETGFHEAAFSEQRYIAYILWNLLCETAYEPNRSMPPVPTGALLSFTQPDQLTGHLHMLIDCIGQYVFTDEEEEGAHSENMQSEAEKIIAYLEQHFTDCDLTLNSLSERFELNPRRVSLLIKQKNGMNYQDYLTSLRIGLAQKLLSGSEHSVTEICLQVGYSNLPHFVRTFKQVTGSTPTMYRKNSESKNETIG